MYITSFGRCKESRKKKVRSYKKSFDMLKIRVLVTLMLLVANLANMKWWKREKWLKPWHVGTILRVLNVSRLMSTSMTGFRGFSDVFVSLYFGQK